jgi:cyanate permease
LATDEAPKSMVASLGSIQNFCGFIGAALAPIVTGAIVQATGSFQMVFLVGAVLLVISTVSYGVFLKKPITAK